jgi:hypothetical protein
MSRFDRDYRRGSRSRAVKDARGILIVTEGTVTEVVYFKSLREQLRLTKDLIKVVHGKGTDPENLVKHAIALREERNCEARKQTSDKVSFDEVWCVLDSEGAERERGIKAAFELAARERVNIALSRPCFEFWLLLHVHFTSSDFPNCDAATAVLSQKIPGYKKNAPPMDQLFGAIPFAVKNAEKLRADHNRTGTVSPVTDVDRLVRVLNEATRTNNQLALPPCP